MRRIATALFVATAFAGLTGSAQATRHPTQTALIKQVKVSASEFKFVLNTKTAKRGVVVFKVTNVGQLPHDFKISGRKTKLLQHGQSDTVRVTFLRKGHLGFLCTVSGHAAAGMKGVLVVK
jgi:uncharacterized cupredoxin-like copper-binding protein